jgi:NAD(P)-dependent dehydrogenase (short-subunit alcohol dehydrogenase family)
MMGKCEKVLITGGEGGIARGIAKRLPLTKDEIFLPSRNELDVTNPYSVHSYINRVCPTILVNVAGYIKPSALKDSNDKEVLDHFMVNTIGSYYCAKYAVLHGCHTIINVGSTSAFEGREAWGAYCASKNALISFTESWAREGICCFSINPARTKTKMREKLFPGEDRLSLMEPMVIGDWIVKILRGDINIVSGSHIIVKKDRVFILPPRECPK